MMCGLLAFLLLLFGRHVLSNSLWRHGLQHPMAFLSRTISGVCPSSCLLNWWCHPTISSLSPSSLSAFNLSQPQSLFQWVSWPKCWSFSFNISASKKYSGLISFKIDWFDLFVFQRTFKSLLQHHLQKHQFFIAQLSLWFNSHIHTWLPEKP